MTDEQLKSAYHDRFVGHVEGLRAVAAAARAEALEKAATLHESINSASDQERHNGDPGAGAMGAVIEYRDAIRTLKEQL